MSQPDSDFLVVGIGASAGGVETLQAFFAQVPADTGCAYVVILHLSPEYESNLAAILQNVTPLPVTSLNERTPVEPNHVYVVSPSQRLTMVDGSIAVAPTTSPAERRAPIDLFFRTLADSHDGRGVCVILSGSGSDGSLGLKQVKERGGAVFVQQPDEAAFAEMPRSAIATDMVDAVLPVAEIPARIVAYAANNSRVTIPEEGELLPATQEQALRELVALLRARTGHDFSQYKRPTLFRRIERRIAVHTLPDLPAYVAHLREHPEETQALLKDLLISVTTFFRDPEAFAALELEVLPTLLTGRGSEAQVRLWVAGCATGEEAYSLAMLCAEHTEGLLDPPRVQVFATDIDEGAIARARSGVYSAADTADLSPERLRRFFVEEQGRYRVRPELRELVLFASHNLLTDPPFSQLDLVSCRNLLIYLDRGAQERVLETFHFALKEDGVLLLGNAETADSNAGLFAPISREQRLYRRRAAGLRAAPPLVTGVIPRIDPPIALVAAEEQERVRERLRSSELHRLLLEQYGPPSLVVTTDFALVHLSERAGRYLQFTGGEPTNDLLALIRPELRVALRAALFQAVQQQAPVEVPNLTLRVEERTEQLTLRVRPVLRPGTPSRGFLLVLFEPEPQAGAPRSSSASVLSADEQVIRQLEGEAQRLRQQLRSSNEQYEVQTEELKAANEELQALNEELRTAAEEQTTSREELQSVNEELRTLNQELKVKVEETTQASANLHNLVNATNIATIFLDRNLRVRLFTPAARSLFNLIPLDQGRSLADITHRLLNVDVLADAEQVFASLQTVEREVRAVDGRVYILRVLPYRIGDDRIGGVVLTFFDITERVRAEASLRESENRLQLVLGASGMGTFRYHIAEDRGEPDARMLALFGLPEHGTLNLAEALTTLIHPDDRGRYAEDVARATNPAGDGLLQSDIRVLQPDGSVRWVAVTARVLFEGQPRRATLMYGVASDISERKQAEARQSFLLMLSDRLRPLSDAEEIQATVTSTALEHFHADRCYYCEIEHGSAVIRQDSARGSLPSVVGAYPVDSQPLFKAVIDAGRPFAVQDTFTTDLLDEPLRQTCIHLQIISFINVPVIKDGQPVGILAVTQCTQRQWTTVDLELAVEVAERTWAAVERGRTAEALAASEEKYRTLFESLDEGVATMELILDDEGRTIDWLYLEHNPALARLTGITQNIVGKKASDIYHHLEPFSMETFGRVVREGAAERFEYGVADLGNRWFDVYAARVGGAGSRQIVLVYNNITERKRREANLAFLAETSEHFALMQSPNEMMEHLGERLARYLNLSRFVFSEVDDEADHITAVSEWQRDTETPSALGSYQISALLTEAGRRQYAAGTFTVIPDTRDNWVLAAPPELLYESGNASIVDVPYHENGRWKFLLTAVRSEPGEWHTDEIELLRELTMRMGTQLERARAQAALRESEHRLRTMAEHLPGGAAFIVDRDLRYLLAEGEALRAAGFEPQEVVGKTIFEVLEPELVTSYEPNYHKALAGEAFLHEHTERGASFLTRGTPLRNTSGEVYAVLAVSYDISARKRAEEALRESEARFRTVTDAVPQMIWTNDGQGNATYFNQRWYTYSGLSYDQSSGPGWQVIVHPDDAPASVDRWQQALAAGEVFETEYRLRRADGVYRWHLGRNVPLRDEAGRIVGWFGTATDIEELKLAEAARQESAVLRRLAKVQEEERLRIARDLHDQLGQQITGLLLRVKQLEEPAQGTAVAPLLPPVQEVAVDLAKEAHRIAVNLRPTALEDVGLVPALERLVADWSRQAGVPAAFQSIGFGTARLPRPVEVALFRVAQEALTNVQKHAQATTVGVILERRGKQVALIVEDNGQGFDPDAAPDGEKGPRLGLLGMRERLTEVDGTLQVESSPESGTTVLARIPLQEDEMTA